MLSSWSLDDLERSPLNGKLDVASRTDSMGDPFMADIGGGGGVGLFIKLLLLGLTGFGLVSSLTVLVSEVAIGPLSTDKDDGNDGTEELRSVVVDDGRNAESSSSSPPSVDIVFYGSL